MYVCTYIHVCIAGCTLKWLADQHAHLHMFAELKTNKLYMLVQYNIAEVSGTAEDAEITTQK